MNIYLIRHGQTDWNIKGKIQGSHDIPLNETGKRQAEQLAEAMDHCQVSRVFSSTLLRARETAEKIAIRQQVPVCPMEQLIEVEFGKWEGMTWEEIKQSYPKEYGLWSVDPALSSPPEGETYKEILRRCEWVLKEILRVTKAEEDAAVVSHGATLAYLLSCMMHNNPQKDQVIVGNASITTVEYNSVTRSYKLTGSNDSSHLI